MSREITTLSKWAKDLTEEKFGKLTVVEYAGTNHRRQAVWKCLCECGHIQEKSAHALKHKTPWCESCQPESSRKSELFTGFIEGERWAVYQSGDYAASSYGRIMRTGRSMSNFSAQGSIMRQKDDGNGYLCAALTINGKFVSEKVHKMVALSFLNVPDDGYNINHLDGDKKNNLLSNLEITTAQGNTHHMLHKGLKKLKLSEKTVVDIRKDFASGAMSHQSIANKYGCSRQYVSEIVNCTARSIAWENQ